jgi:2-C-methyl-D-erythritol 4-phosphate cytidylyltransferase
MGASVPKPYLDLAGKPVLAHTLKGFDHPELVCQIIICVAADWLEVARKAALSAGLSIPVFFVEGGSERIFSINNALRSVHPQAKYIAVHDAVRPFFSVKLLRALHKEATLHGAAIPGVRVSDTIKRISAEGLVVETPMRETLRAVQTPQVFLRTLLQEAYNHAMAQNLFATDDAATVEQYGSKVKVIEGESDNIKLTYPADFKRAIQILEHKQSISS